jgi:glucosamine-6-phosphate deaminase
VNSLSEVSSIGLSVHVAADRKAMGARAATDVAEELRYRLSRQPEVRMIFAAAPSQSEMLAALRAAPGIAWDRVTAFHMDEYIGLPAIAPQRFGLWLREALFDHLPFKAVHLLEPGQDPEAAAQAYSALLAEAPIDIVCLGIGANGHLAFNDPPADLDDPLDVRVVMLDDVCRQQQVDDACFAAFDDVPAQALTLTVPRLLRADLLYCVVPGSSKREAVARALSGPIDGSCPASALRRHHACNLYLDPASAPEQ